MTIIWLKQRRFDLNIISNTKFIQIRLKKQANLEKEEDIGEKPGEGPRHLVSNSARHQTGDQHVFYQRSRDGGWHLEP